MTRQDVGLADTLCGGGVGGDHHGRRWAQPADDIKSNKGPDWLDHTKQSPQVFFSRQISGDFLSEKVGIFLSTNKV